MRRHAISKALIACAAVALVPGCAEYLDRKDSVHASLGDAVQGNIVSHTIDPWPAHARNTNIAFNGRRAADAVARYCADKVKEPRGLSTTDEGAGDAGGGPLTSVTITNNNAPAGGQAAPSREVC